MSIDFTAIVSTEGAVSRTFEQIVVAGYLNQMGVAITPAKRAAIVAAITEQARALAYAELSPDWKARITFTEQLESAGLYPWPPGLNFPPSPPGPP